MGVPSRAAAAVRSISAGLRVLLPLVVAVQLTGCAPPVSRSQSAPAASRATSAADPPAVQRTAASERSSPTHTPSAEPSQTAPTRPPAQADASQPAAGSPATPASEATAAAAETAEESPSTPRTNRLARETSPYLRLHMHNPVDWYPWGPEAFEKARRENKLVFLSVGYSSCYWCHVMERESFMDQQIAALLNERFVCIKVDREERPDVDAIYMLAVQLVTGHGGWPMSVFLTPDARPFFGGTYFPARDGDRPGAAGFLTVLTRLDQLWTQQREQVLSTSVKLTEAIQKELSGGSVAGDAPLNPQLAEKTSTSLAASFDDVYGGFGYSADDPLRPKFPEASRLCWLLDRAERTQDADCLRMLTVTLDRMRMGGIWDHIGGGFHRYSTDRFWRIPHFEKMLYDNGQLLSVYARAYRLTQRDDYRQTVAATVTFLLREMRDPGGAFYAALDAESDHVEGKYYRWTQDEVRSTLGDDYALYAAIYGLTGEPNFEDEYYAPQFAQPLKQLAKEQGMTVAELQPRLAAMNDKLLAVRSQRPRPLTDDKILCSWNGLVIRGLADAGRYCEEPAYTAAAEESARFLLARLRGPDGRLRRTFSQGEAKLAAYLDDYAFLVDGLIGLHQATGKAEWLELADELTRQQLEHYWDEANGAFFFTARDHETLIARSKHLVDEAQPAGNSVAASNLIYLARQLNRADYRSKAEQTIRNALPLMEKFPGSAPRMAIALVDVLDQDGSSGP